MTTTLCYEDLDMDRVNTVFTQQGELLVSLPSNHAKALVQFIETVQTAQSWGPSRTPFLSRLVPLAKSLVVTLRITIAHSRLFSLGRVIVLNSTSQTWERMSESEVLFRFRA